MNGQPVADSNDLRNDVGLRERGSKITLTIIRKGEQDEITLEVGAARVAGSSGALAVPQLADVTITEIPVDHPAKGEVQCVYVAEVASGSPAWRFGLRSRDIITAINRKQVVSVGEFNRTAKATGGVLALDILRGDTNLFIAIQ